MEDDERHFEPRAEITSLPASPKEDTPDSGDTLVSMQAASAKVLAASRKLSTGHLDRKASAKLAVGSTPTRSRTL